jgi:CubicO group peptidase (beta-lactamase class C family)
VVRRLGAAAVGCVMALLLGAGVPSVTGTGSRGVDRAGLDRFLAVELARTGLPGMAVTITHGPDVLYVKWFGSDGHGHDVTSATQFRLASLSKSFTTVAVLQLVEAGKVELDAPVQGYLPEFGTAEPDRSHRITVRHLLNQTSGIGDAGLPTGGEPDTVEQRVRSLRTARLVSEPGREFHYSDSNYQILARLVEVVAGMPFGSYLRERVFAPLGMADTVATDTAAEGTRAAPRLARGAVLVFDVPVARSELDGLLAGSGGVISTAQDMSRWLVMQSNGGRAGTATVLDASGIELMHTPPAGIDSTYGQGWQVVTPGDGPRRIEHTGVLSTFFADQVLLPEHGYAFALLYDGNSALADTAGVTAALATHLAGGPPAAGARSTRIMALVLAGLTLATLALRTRSLLRLRRWETRRRGSRWWTAGPGIVWLLLPVGLLIGMPALLLVLIDRSFTFWQLCLAMPDLVIFLAVAALTGTVVASGQVIRIRSARAASAARPPRPA